MSDIVFDGMVFDRLREIGDQSQRITELEAEIARLRLTDEEREAVEVCAHAAENCNGFGGDPTRPAIYEGRQVAATLRGLLERLK